MSDLENKNIIKKIKDILGEQDSASHVDKLQILENEHPQNITIKQALSMAYLQRNENTKALKYINEADKLSPKNHIIKFNLGMMHKKFNKFDEAIAFFKESISLNANFKEGLNILADIYYNKKEFQVSMDYYKKSLKLDDTKENIFAMQRFAEILLKLYLKEKDKRLLEESKFYYQKINTLIPNSEIILKKIILINNLLGLKNESILIDKSFNGIFVIDQNIDEIKIEY